MKKEPIMFVELDEKGDYKEEKNKITVKNLIDKPSCRLTGNITFDESYYSIEYASITYYFTTDAELIERMYPGRYEDAVSSEISLEISLEDQSISTMISPTAMDGGVLTDYDWNEIDLPDDEISKLLSMAKEPIILVELDEKGYYKRFALTLREFHQKFSEAIRLNNYDFSKGAYTIKPLVHMWYMPTEIGDKAWETFFTNMAEGIPSSDVERGNLATIDFDRMGLLKEKVLETVCNY